MSPDQIRIRHDTRVKLCVLLAQRRRWTLPGRTTVSTLLQTLSCHARALQNTLSSIFRLTVFILRKVILDIAFVNGLLLGLIRLQQLSECLLIQFFSQLPVFLVQYFFVELDLRYGRFEDVDRFL